MKKLIFTVVGALFLFVSCQSDDLQIDEAAKSANATKVTKTMTIKSYEGTILYVTGGDGCGMQFVQKGTGIASHIGQFSVINTGCLETNLNNFEGIMTAANGDMIYYNDIRFECADSSEPEPCPEVEATFYYTIYGGTGRFANAEGTLVTEGVFVEGNPVQPTPFTVTAGWAEITY